MSDMDALVELAARALCIDAKHEGNQRFDDWHKEQARAALLAVGLPALLERVEAVEGEVARLRIGLDGAHGNADRMRKSLLAERDALAAKVADAGAAVADAWDDGWRVGRSDGKRQMIDHAHPRTPNPHRTALDASETP